MYKSPIEIIYGQLQRQFDDDILRAVQEYGIKVEKEELIKALSYERNQYDNGYKDGYCAGRKEAMETIVHCKDCKHVRGEFCCRTEHYKIVEPEYYCGHGAREDDNDG